MNRLHGGLLARLGLWAQSTPLMCDYRWRGAMAVSVGARATVIARVTDE
jgi:hypothetical protein